MLKNLATQRNRFVLAALAALAVAWPFFAPASTQFYGGLAVIYALVSLSLTMLTGWAGQVSLGHAAFLGLGVYTLRPLLDHGVPLVVGLPLAGLVCALASLVLGIPSLRLRGVYLAIATLAFGMFCQNFLFILEAVSGGVAAHIVERPSLVATDRALYLVLLGPLALALVVVRRLRHSDVGRVLFAIRDSEDASRALGINLAPYKIGVFAFSAALTGIAGGFYALLIGATPAGNQFGVLQSWFFLAMPVIGGLESLVGSVVGGAILAGSQPVVNAVGVRLFLASGLLTVVVLLARTGGVAGAVLRLRDSFTRALGREPEVAASFLPEDRRSGAAAGAARLRVLATGTPVHSGRVLVRVKGVQA